MPDINDEQEQNKREIRGAIAFAEDALRRAYDSMELQPGDPVDSAYVEKQLNFVLRYSELALDLVRKNRLAFQTWQLTDPNAPHDAAAAE